MPPPCRNHLHPTAPDTPTAAAASSLVTPVAITPQNSRWTSRRLGVAEHPGDRGVGVVEAVGDGVELFADRDRGGLGEDRSDPRADHLAVGLGGLGQGVAHEMDPAPLPCGALQDPADRGDETAVGVGDDELDAGQAAFAQIGEELGPERLGLVVPDRAAEDLAVPVGADAGRDDHGLGHDAAVDADLAVGAAREYVREGSLVQGPGPPGGDLRVELGADPGDLGLADPCPAERDDEV